MSRYKIFDGSFWCDPCDKAVNIIKADGTFESIDPNTKTINYYDGTTWKRIFCGLQCGDSLSLSGATGVFYIPFLKYSGADSVTINITTYSVPDAIQVLNQSKTTVLASSPLYGDDGSFFPPVGTYTYNEYLYDNTSGGFTSTGNTENITFYDTAAYQTWNSLVLYTLGDTVRYNNRLWQVNVASTIGTNPITSTDWTNVTNNNIWIVDPVPTSQTFNLNYSDVGNTNEEVLWIRVIGSPLYSTLWQINYITCGSIYE